MGLRDGTAEDMITGERDGQMRKRGPRNYHVSKKELISNFPKHCL